MGRGRQQHGFSLVEMMVAMVLGLLLVATVVQVFLSNRASYRYNQALSTVQDNARFALHTLARDLRMSGYSGCPKSVDLDLAVTSTRAAEANVDTGSLAESISLPGSDLPDSAVSGSDAVRIAYMRDFAVRVNGDTSTSAAEFKATGNPAGWKQGEILLVVDCLRGQGDLFTATNNISQSSGIVTIAHASDGNTTNKLSQTYVRRARVLSPYRAIYYVGDTGKTDSAGNPVRSLYRWRTFPSAATTVRSPEPLLRGVDDLAVRYGVDRNANASPDEYVTGTDVVDWDDVVALRVGFVVQSDRPIGAGNGTLDLFGTDVTSPDDGYLRRVFTTTVALRNRVP